MVPLGYISVVSQNFLPSPRFCPKSQKKPKINWMSARFVFTFLISMPLAVGSRHTVSFMTARLVANKVAVLVLRKVAMIIMIIMIIISCRQGLIQLLPMATHRLSVSPSERGSVILVWAWFRTLFSPNDRNGFNCERTRVLCNKKRNRNVIIKV